LLEKVVTLQVARAAKAEFDGSGVELLMTRDTDVNLGIRARANLAKRAKAEVFVSIHFNAAQHGSAPAQGTETWIGKWPSVRSSKLAAAVHAAVLAATGLRDRGVKVDTVSGVIDNRNHDPKTAHCLVETSFLDRQLAEESRLRTQAYINRLGRSVHKGISDFLIGEGLLPSQEVANQFPDEPEDAATPRVDAPHPRRAADARCRLPGRLGG
jgi:N-acetylmuramoyl-L-alanine amidase